MSLPAYLRTLIVSLPLAGATVGVILSGISLYQVAANRVQATASAAKAADGQVLREEPTPVAPALRATDGNEFIARPLFDRTRRPPVPPPPPAVAPAALPRPVAVTLPVVKPPAPTVLGVVSTTGRHVALVRAANDPQLRYVESGNIVGGWRVVAIFPDRVRFGRDDDEIERPVFPPIPASLPRGTTRTASSRSSEAPTSGAR